MTTRKKILWGTLAVLVIAGLVILIIYLRGLNKPANQSSPSPTPTQSPDVRGLGNEKFGNRARNQSAANVDVGVLTVKAASQTPVATPSAQARVSSVVAQLYAPTPMPSKSPATSTRTTAAPTPPPPTAPPTFEPLAPPPEPQTRELAIVYAKGSNGKRQIYLRSLDRDKDEQLVSSVFDDYGVTFSSAAQKVAFYSNEEGPSDTVKARTKLKVVDLATDKVVTLMGNLPGNWPVAWSSDGKKLAIPTASSILIADVTTGKSLQVPTGQNPGAIAWAPGNLKFYFQAETAADNNDIFQADGITAQAEPVTKESADERLPAVSVDGTKVTFLRSGAGSAGGTAVVVKSIATDDEKTYEQTAPADTYLFNLDLNDLVFVQGDKEPRLSRFKGGTVQTIGNLGGPTVVSWDRDYHHVFVLADDDQGKALFTINIETGQAEKVKAGISSTVPSSTR